MKRGGKGFIVENEFYCTRCGSKGIPIVRKRGQEREAGHLKRIFCLKCQEEVNHVECKPFSHYEYCDFLTEFDNHNFDDEGNRKMTYGQLKQQLNQKVSDTYE